MATGLLVLSEKNNCGKLCFMKNGESVFVRKSARPLLLMLGLFILLSSIFAQKKEAFCLLLIGRRSQFPRTSLS